MLSSQTPTLVLKDGQVQMVTGSPGGRTIPNTTLWVVLNYLEFGLSPARAVDAPRTHHQWFPDELVLEGRVVAGRNSVGPARHGAQAESRRIARESPIRSSSTAREQSSSESPTTEARRRRPPAIDSPTSCPNRVYKSLRRRGESARRRHRPPTRSRDRGGCPASRIRHCSSRFVLFFCNSWHATCGTIAVFAA